MQRTGSAAVIIVIVGVAGVALISGSPSLQEKLRNGDFDQIGADDLPDELSDITLPDFDLPSLSPVDSDLCDAVRRADKHYIDEPDTQQRYLDTVDNSEVDSIRCTCAEESKFSFVVVLATLQADSDAYRGYAMVDEEALESSGLILYKKNGESLLPRSEIQNTEENMPAMKKCSL